MISIVIAYYNIGWLIGRCLESIAEQTYTDYEVILIDNGSTDQSKQAVDDIMTTTKIHNCHYHRIQHVSHNAAINYGLNWVKGDYIFLMDGHDFLNIEALNYFYWAAIQSHADMIIGDFKDVHYTTRITNITKSLGYHVVDTFTPDKLIWRMHIPVSHTDMRFNRLWNKLYKTDLFKDMQLSDDMGCEISLILQILFKCQTVGTIAVRDYFRVKMPQDHMDMSVIKAYQERVDFIQAHQDDYKSNLLPNAQCLVLNNMYELCRSGINAELREQYQKELINIYKEYRHTLPDNAYSKIIIRFCKNLLTK